MNISVFDVTEVKVKKFTQDNPEDFYTVSIWDAKNNEIELYFNFPEEIEKLIQDISMNLHATKVK